MDGVGIELLQYLEGDDYILLMDEASSLGCFGRIRGPPTRRIEQDVAVNAALSTRSSVSTVQEVFNRPEWGARLQLHNRLLCLPELVDLRRKDEIIFG